MKLYECITPDLAAWLLAQPVFFVASAPARGRHVNVSPKGRPASCLAVLGPLEVAYVDATGSGSETVAHVRENGRLTLMACSFGPAPRILRLFADASVVEREGDQQQQFQSLISRMDLSTCYIEGARAVLHLRVFAVQTACGYGVPKLSLSPDTDPESNGKKPYLADRDTLAHWAANKTDHNQLLAYRAANNAASLDGLPGLRSAATNSQGGRGRGQWLVYETKVWAGRHRRVLELLLAALAGAVTTALFLALYLAGYMHTNTTNY